MSKRPLFNRQRVFIPARPRRLVSTFVPVLIGLSSLRVLPLPPIAPNLTEAPPLFAQSSRLADDRSGVGSGADGQNQVVFFSIPVAVDGAIVRSGPSEDAYPTGGVGKNRYVEAYFRDADGWCAIRPPQGSFSWINAKFVRRENDSTGRVVASNGKAVPARVGGATVEESAIVQVGLPNGRQIKILGETRLADGSTWLKIAPPSGEFRWLHSSALLDDPAIAQLPNKLTFQREFLDQLARASAERPVASLALENVANSGQLAQNTQNGRFSESVSPSANVVPETLPASVVASGALGTTQSADSPQNLQSPQIAPASQTAQPTPIAQPTPNAQTAQTDATEEYATQFKMEIARLNADVFQTLRQNPPSDADLALLATRAERLFDAAPTDGERFVVQSIYDAIKIAERRNRSRSNDAAQGARDLPVSPNAPHFPAPNGTLNSPYPAQSSQPPYSFPRAANATGRSDEFGLEGNLPTLVLPDSNFDASVPAASAPTLGAANDFNFPQFAQNADFNAQNGVSPPWNAQNFAAFPNGVSFDGPNQASAPASEKRPRLAFAFSDANNPFRARAKTKEVRVAPFAPQSGERSSGISKLPPLLPTQKQLIVPPPNYRSGPFGKNDRANGKKDADSTNVASTATRRSSDGSSSTKLAQAAKTAEFAKSAEAAENTEAAQTEQATQELTVDSVRWRAVKTNVDATSNSDASASTVSTASPVAASSPASSNAASSAVATAKVAKNAASANAEKAGNAENAGNIGNVGNVAKASPIGATVASKPPVLTGASVPQTSPKNKNANKNSSKNANKNAFQPVASRSVAAFDAYGVLAKLPKAPKGTPQYALTRPVGDGERFEIVSYLEAEKDVSLERYVGRKIGVKGTRGTIQIGGNTQKLTTVQTVFTQE